jgi:hypothetical protein
MQIIRSASGPAAKLATSSFASTGPTEAFWIGNFGLKPLQTHSHVRIYVNDKAWEKSTVSTS